jgi:hypothetical protein
MASRLGWTDEGKTGGAMKDFIPHARNRSRARKEFLAILEEHDAIAYGHQVIADQGHTVSQPPSTARPA